MNINIIWKKLFEVTDLTQVIDGFVAQDFVKYASV